MAKLLITIDAIKHISMVRIILVISLSFFIMACEGGQKGASSAADTPATTPAETPTAPAETPAAPATAASATYPSIAGETVKMLWDKCDYIDFVFYYLNFSMSQKVQNSIRATIAQISTAVPEIDPNCQPIGRIFFQSEGVNIMEADIFYSNGCAYYIFYEDGKYAYANRMLPTAEKFYDNIFKQVQGQQK